MDFRNYATDIEALSLSSLKEGAYFIITCACGCPGCAGIDMPVRVTHEKEYVTWYPANPLPERILTFKKEDYHYSIYSLLNEYLVTTERYRRKFMNADWHMKPSVYLYNHKYLLQMREKLAKLIL
ncbi:MAG: hypothetical protein KGZ74_01370 [Chitinophagaceae bacterium]|nr:hypothetical protein [Chitinophagaceae bacterium]